MKQIIYLGGKKARNYTAPHEETDVIGDCDWKEGEVKTEGVDYEPFWLDENKIVPIPKKQEGESQKSMLEEIESVYLNDGTGPMFDYIEDNFILTRKS